MPDKITLSTADLYALIDKIVSEIKDKHGITEDEWVDTETAMDLLKIKSKTTLQSLRDNREIIFSHPKTKILLYNRRSILDYISKHQIG